VRRTGRRSPGSDSLEVLLERVRQEDADHRARTQKPISADALRVQLSVGSAKARRLVEIVRAEFEARNSTDLGEGDWCLRHGVQQPESGTVPGRRVVFCRVINQVWMNELAQRERHKQAGL
jgi:hypothetical protein